MKKASPEEIRRVEDLRNKMIFTRNTIRRLLWAHEKDIRDSDGVYDELWSKYKADLRLANKLIKEYDKFLDDQGIYHSNSHTDIDEDAKQKLSSVYGEVHNGEQADQV